MSSEIDADFEARIASYLAQHPDFFLRHEELLETLRVPHRTGDAVSLLEHKIRMLEDKAGRYRRQLEELIEVARDNDRLNQRLHQLTLRLIEATTLDEVLATLQDELRGRFQADAVELKLFSEEELEQAHVSEAGLAIFQKFMRADKPTCGPLAGDKFKVLFGDQAGESGSAALIPIRTTELSGMLAIGSRDRERFHAGKGVDFLIRLGEVVSLTLQAVHPQR